MAQPPAAPALDVAGDLNIFLIMTMKIALCKKSQIEPWANQQIQHSCLVLEHLTSILLHRLVSIVTIGWMLVSNATWFRIGSSTCI